MGAVTVRLLLWMLLLWHTSLFALEVDVPMLLQIVEENRNVVQERLILAKYYKEQKNMLKAELLVDEVLEIDADNADAKRMKMQIKEERRINTILRKEGVYSHEDSHSADKVLKNLYATKEYTRYETLYSVLIQKKYSLQDLSHSNAARVYLRVENYPASKNATARITGKENDRRVTAIGEKLQKRQEKHLASLQQAYEAIGDYQTLYAYAQTLYDLGRSTEATTVAEKYNRKKGEKSSFYFEAQLLVWSNQLDKAILLLQKEPLKSDPEAKVMLGKVYSWRQNYAKAVPLLQEVRKETTDANLLYEADKALAFIALWQKKNEEAKKTLITLQQARPEDREVKEAVMELNDEYALLINIYKKRLQQEPANPHLHLRLGRLLQRNNQKIEAVRHLEFYLKSYPNNIEAAKELQAIKTQQENTYRESPHLEIPDKLYFDGHYEAALFYYENHLQTRPDDYDSWKEAAKELQAIKTQQKNTYQKSPHLEIADKLYFDGHYEAALFYYENHLQTRPDDYDCLFRYAFALENAKMHGKAESEFYLMHQKRSTDNIAYHYAYNMMKNGKTAEAETIFLDLKQRVLKPLPPLLETFVNGWREAWQDKNYERYLPFYGPRYTENRQWVEGRKSNFKQSRSCVIEVYDPLYRSLGDNTLEISFYQTFSTKRATDKGYKTLTIACDASGYASCQIVDERYSEGAYNKRELLEPNIDVALKVIERASPIGVFEKKTLSMDPSLKRYHDIVLPSALDKDLNPEDVPFANVYAKPSSVTSASHFLEVFQGIQEAVKLNAIQTSVYYFEDSDKFRRFLVDARFKRAQLYDNLDVGIDAGYFAFERIGVTNHSNGVRYGATLYADGWGFRLGANHFENFTEFAPTVTYAGSYKSNTFLFEWTHQNAIFYTDSLAVYEERISTNHFQLSDYLDFDWGSFWGGLEVNAYSDDNTAVIPQFDFQFFRQEFFDDTFRYTLAAEGWYMYNTEPSILYYSPESYDSTQLRLDPSLKLYGDVWLLAFAGAGYSSSTESSLYKYGLKVAVLHPDSLQFIAGCQESNNAQTSFGFSPDYSYVECRADLGYAW